MAELKNEDILAVKGQGFLLNRNTGLFSGRIVPRGTVFTAEDMKNIAELAERYGNGKVFATVRLSIEIPGIPFEKIDAAKEFAENCGIYFGGTGNKIRPVTACKGTTCIYGNFDTQALAGKIHDEYYVRWRNITLPHKFKIGVGGCPNSCMKPSLNDFGVEGHRVPVYNPEDCHGCKNCAVEKACNLKAARVQENKLIIDRSKCMTCGLCTGKCPFKAVAHDSAVVYQIYVGGTWGKSTRMGTPLSRFVTEDEILPVLEKTLLWFREHAYVKERFGIALDRIGIDSFERAVFTDDILKRKDEILSKDLLNRK